MSSPQPPVRPLLAVLDYPGRREEAAVADLRLHEHGFDVCYLLTDPLPYETSAGAYARRLVDRLDPGRPVTAVLAYCLAAGIGHEVAAALTTPAAPAPPLVLFDAGAGSVEAVVEAYHSAVVQLGGGPDEGPDVVAMLAADVPAQQRSAALVAAMRTTLTRLAIAALLDDDDEPEDVAETAAQLTERHLRWVVHLVAAATAGSPAWGGDVLHVMSRDHPFADDWPGAGSTRPVRVDCSRRELLRTAQTAQAVLSWLAARDPVPSRS